MPHSHVPPESGLGGVGECSKRGRLAMLYPIFARASSASSDLGWISGVDATPTRRGMALSHNVDYDALPLSGAWIFSDSLGRCGPAEPGCPGKKRGQGKVLNQHAYPKPCPAVQHPALVAGSFQSWSRISREAGSRSRTSWFGYCPGSSMTAPAWSQTPPAHSNSRYKIRLCMELRDVVSSSPEPSNQVKLRHLNEAFRKPQPS